MASWLQGLATSQDRKESTSKIWYARSSPLRLMCVQLIKCPVFVPNIQTIANYGSGIRMGCDLLCRGGGGASGYMTGHPMQWLGNSTTGIENN